MVSHYLPLEDVSGRVSRPIRVGVSANGAALERTDPPALHHLHWYPLYLAAILFPRHLPSELVFNRIAICMGSFVCLVSMLQGFDRAVNLPRLALTCFFISRIDRSCRVSQPRPLRSSRSVLFWRTLQFQAFKAPNVVFAQRCSRHLPLPANQHRNHSVLIPTWRTQRDHDFPSYPRAVEFALAVASSHDSISFLPMLEPPSIHRLDCVSRWFLLLVTSQHTVHVVI